MIKMIKYREDLKKEFRKIRASILRQIPKSICTCKYKDSYVSIREECVEYLYELTSSTVFKLHFGDEIKYFRECENHSQIRQYISTFLEFFFRYISKEEEAIIEKDRRRILNSLSNNNNLRRFRELKRYIDLNQIYSSAFGNLDFSRIGLETSGDDEYKKRLRPFIMYASTKVINYSFNDYFGSKNKVHSFFSNKTIAYREIAKLLHIEYLVPEVEYTYLSIGNYKLFGFIMNQADGVNGELIPLDKRGCGITPQLQHDFMNLSILDYLCEIRDHKSRNYNVIIDDSGRFVGIRSFDNNEPASFGFEPCLCVEDYRKCSCITGPEYINRPFFDKNVVESLMMISKQDLHDSLSAYLQRKQILRIYERLKHLQFCISNTQRINTDFLLSDDDWDYKTIEKEFLGKYGKTYLICFATELI